MNHIDTMKLALEALELNRRTHYYCEDTWYSCPKHEDGCANEAEGDECNCGADQINAQIDNAITALREALAEQQAQRQEPYGWHTEDHLTDRSATTYSKDVADRWKSKGWPVTPLYTSPPAQPSKPWVRLTPEQQATIAEANNMMVDDDLFAAIEAELKEKNT